MPILFLSLCCLVFAQEEPETLVLNGYKRLTFDHPVVRVASSNPDVIEAESLLVNDREALLRGLRPGRSEVIIWFADGTQRTVAYQVVRDLSVLEEALMSIHPSITIDPAPDRDALVLRGQVPTQITRARAEVEAAKYLRAGNRSGADQERLRRSLTESLNQVTSEGVADEDWRDLAFGAISNVAVINLIEVETAQLPLERRIEQAVTDVVGASIHVRRILRGEVPNDEQDVLLLEGEVANQVALTRSILIASQMFLGKSVGESEIEVLADESGALAGNRRSQGQQQGGGQNQGQGVGITSLGGLQAGNSIRQLQNLVRTNIARAKVIQVDGGRVLSFLEVTDIPQVRVSVQIYEVNRRELDNYGSNLALVNSDFDQGSLDPSGVASLIQGDSAARVGGAGRSDVQNVLGFLDGSLSNQVQVSGSNFAVDWAFSLLESVGVARRVASPSLTVLSGERASFQVGGQIPVPVTNQLGDANTVFVSTIFQEFGLSLSIRPLVEDDGYVTLDVIPLFSRPDTILNNALVESGVSQLPTTSFETRVLQTSSRLEDGDALVVGGLKDQSLSETLNEAPFFSDIPLLGWLFGSTNDTRDDFEYVIVVSPLIVRDAKPELAVWEFPDATSWVSKG